MVGLTRASIIIEMLYIRVVFPVSPPKITIIQVLKNSIRAPTTKVFWTRNTRHKKMGLQLIFKSC